MKSRATREIVFAWKPPGVVAGERKLEPKLSDFNVRVRFQAVLGAERITVMVIRGGRLGSRPWTASENEREAHPGSLIIMESLNIPLLCSTSQ